MDERGQITLLLREWRAGDAAAGERVIALVYEELDRIASRHLRGERAGHTFATSDLIAEAYLRLAGGPQPEWADRVHFYATAARTMRRILVDHARKRSTDKRGGGAAAIPFNDTLAALERPEAMLALDAALEELFVIDERKARALELRYFAGMTHEEIAKALEVHANTIASDLRLAEAWVRRSLTATSSG